MKNLIIAPLMLPFLISCVALHLSKSPTPFRDRLTQVKPPRAAEIPHDLQLHGDVRVDNYYWLKERDDQRVLSYLAAENSYTNAVMKGTEQLRAQILDELKARVTPDDATVPAKHGPYFYYERYEAGKEHPIYCRQNSTLSHEEILLDSNELAKDEKYFSIFGVSPSTNHRLLAFGVDTVGNWNFTVRLKDLTTGQFLREQIPNSTIMIAWASNSKSFLYLKQNPQTLRAESVYRHIIGQDPKRDVLVYKENDPAFKLAISRSLSGNYLFIVSKSTTSTEMRYLPAARPQGRPTLFSARQKNHEYNVLDGGDRFYVRTNLGAKNFRLMEASYGKTNGAQWKEVVPSSGTTLLEDFRLFRNYLVLKERENGLSRFRVIDRRTWRSRSITVDDPAYILYWETNLEFDTENFRYSYESPNRPATVYDYHLSDGQRVLKKERLVPGFKPELYETVRLLAPAADGTKIPITLVRKKNLQPLDANRPLLIYGYGSYGYSIDASFESKILSLLDRGFIYAIAHVRGGSEMGRQWYEDGRQLSKMNTFSDFIACTTYLHNEGYSSPPHTYAMGESAGGLLIGAVINTRADLFRGAIANVPFVDILTTMLDPTIPLTTEEYDEWGNPHEKQFYDYIKSYSPYDNVSARAYPHLLVTAGYHDSQVQYWEPAKWVAKLRRLKRDQNALLLQMEMTAGHGGKSGRFEKLALAALQYAFLLAVENERP